MRHIISIALILVLTGCANARQMCGLEGDLEWSQSYGAPRERASLLALVPKEQGLGQAYEKNHHYWFKRSDGAFLLCRQNPQQLGSLGRCNSDGWVFERRSGQWRAHRDWASMCTE